MQQHMIQRSNDERQTAVHSYFLALQSAIGPHATIEKLRVYIEQQRGKPLRMEDDAAMPTGITGISLTLADCDLILIRTRLDSERFRFSQLHELAHIVLGHLPQQIPRTPSYSEFRRRFDALEPLQRDTWMYRVLTGYGEPEEYMAELLATQLAGYIDAHPVLFSPSLLTLHNLMVSLAPNAHLPTNELLLQRVHLEIADAREYVLSHTPFIEQPNYQTDFARAARKEAALLDRLARNRQVFRTIGSHIAQLLPQNIQHYNMLLADILASIQQA